MEAWDILERGDSLIATEDIPFDKDNCATLINGWHALLLIERGDTPPEGEMKCIPHLPQALNDVCAFYTLRVKVSSAKYKEAGQKYDEAIKTMPETLKRGDIGNAIIYGGYEERIPAHILDKGDGTTDFQELARWKKHQQSILKHFENTADTDPAMLGIPFHREKYGQELTLLTQDIERHQKTAEAISELLQKFDGLDFSVSEKTTELTPE